MNRFKFQAFGSEFLFMDRLAAGDALSCDDIQIKRIDANLLAHIPEYNGATGSLVGISDGEKIAFVLEDGSIIEDAVQTAGYVHHNEAHWDAESWDGETVLEAIDRHDVAEVLAFVVSVEYGYNVENHHSQDNWQMTIYKPAKDANISTLISRARAEALSQVKAQAEF